MSRAAVFVLFIIIELLNSLTKNKTIEDISLFVTMEGEQKEESWLFLP